MPEWLTSAVRDRQIDAAGQTLLVDSLRRRMDALEAPIPEAPKDAAEDLQELRALMAEAREVTMHLQQLVTAARDSTIPQEQVETTPHQSVPEDSGV